MRIPRLLALGVLLSAGRFALAVDDRAAKEGALEEKRSPAADLKHQEENLARLRQNAKEDRKAGNRAGAWAAEWDARHVEKLIRKDRKLLQADGSK